MGLQMMTKQEAEAHNKKYGTMDTIPDDPEDSCSKAWMEKQTDQKILEGVFSLSVKEPGPFPASSSLLEMVQKEVWSEAVNKHQLENLSKLLNGSIPPVKSRKNGRCGSVFGKHRFLVPLMSAKEEMPNFAPDEPPLQRKAKKKKKYLPTSLTNHFFPLSQ